MILDNESTHNILAFLGRQGQQKRLSVPIILVDEKGEDVPKERNHSGVWKIKGPLPRVECYNHNIIRRTTLHQP
jgi:hypothetical protein